MPHLDTIAITCKARCFSPTVLTHRTLQRTFHTDHDSVALDFYFYNFDIRQVQRYFYVHHCALRIPYSAFPSLDSTPICRLYPRMLRRARFLRAPIPVYRSAWLMLSMCPTRLIAWMPISQRCRNMQRPATCSLQARTTWL